MQPITWDRQDRPMAYPYGRFEWPVETGEEAREGSYLRRYLRFIFVSSRKMGGDYCGVTVCTPPLSKLPTPDPEVSRG